MNDDTELLRRYAEMRDEEAFAELVRRHVNLVHTAALRQVNGDAHLAAEVTQAVFTDLARKAATLTGHRVLAGWLFTSTRFAAAKAVRSEQRRHAREGEAHLMQELMRETEAPLDWARVRPVLDDVIGQLNASDREAVLLRFFEGRDYAGVGAQLNVNDNTARMRVERALDKLRGLLEQRGLKSSSAALGAALAAHAVAAAPIGLAANVTGAALASGGALTAATAVTAATTAAGATTFFTMTKVQLAFSGALAAASLSGLAVQLTANSDLRNDVATLRREIQDAAPLRAENTELTRTAAELAGYRADDATLAQMRDQAAELQRRQQSVMRAEQTRLASAQAVEVYDISRLDVAPRPRFQARPAYPFEMRRAGVNGEVMVAFVIDPEGVPRDVRAVRSGLTSTPRATVDVEAGKRAFEAAAVQAVEKWRFAAGEKNGVPVNARMQVPIVFTLNPNE